MYNIPEFLNPLTDLNSVVSLGAMLLLADPETGKVFVLHPDRSYGLMFYAYDDRHDVVHELSQNEGAMYDPEEDGVAYVIQHTRTHSLTHKEFLHSAMALAGFKRYTPVLTLEGSGKPTSRGYRSANGLPQARTSRRRRHAHDYLSPHRKAQLRSRHTMKPRLTDILTLDLLNQIRSQRLTVTVSTQDETYVIASREGLDGVDSGALAIFRQRHAEFVRGILNDSGRYRQELEDNEDKPVQKAMFISQFMCKGNPRELAKRFSSTLTMEAFLSECLKFAGEVTTTWRVAFSSPTEPALNLTYKDYEIANTVDVKCLLRAMDYIAANMPANPDEADAFLHRLEAR